MLFLLFAALGAFSFHRAIARRAGSSELAFHRTAGILGVFLLLAPDLLSATGALSATGFTVAALLLASAGIFLAWKWKALEAPAIPASTWWIAAFPLAVGIFLAGAGSAPNNWDSMTYHLARVAQWASRGFVGIYPTGIQFQVTHPAWAERALLPLYLCFGGDRWVFLLQFLLWLGCGAQVWWIAPRNKAVAALFALALPMAVLQASSTQNDLADAFWALQFFSALRLAGRAPSTSAKIDAGVSLGLLFAVKGTAYLFAPAIFLALWLSGEAVWASLPVAVPVAVALNVTQLVPEWLVFGNPLPSGGESYLLGRITPLTWAATLLKNVALHLNGPWEFWNEALVSALGALHSLLGLATSDRDLVSLRTGFSLPPLFLYEDFDGNTFFFLLSVAALAAAWLRKRARELRPYYLAFALGLAFFSFLRWNPWHARLHLPLFLILAPGVALATELAWGARPAWALAALSCLLALPYGWLNRTRPVLAFDGAPSVFQIPREMQYFSSRPVLARKYIEMARELSAKKCERVGILTDWNSYEYPLWALLGYPENSALRIVHVNVENETGSLYGKDEQAGLCATLDLRNQP